MAKERNAPIGGPVLITRPQPSASMTAEKLVALGFSPVSLPVSRTFTLPFHIGDQSFDALAVTSANAFRHVPSEILQSLKALPLFAVGEGTARAAQEAGFQTVIEGGGDATRLAATIAEHLPKNARLLYLAGRVRQSIFEDKVSEAGLNMEVRDVYDVESINYSVNEIKATFDQGPFVAVLLYSAIAAQAFVETMQKLHIHFDAETRFFCISERVCRELPEQWRVRALVAHHPDESGIFRLFSKL
ncbi:uroporphyrinogen-III synthase [Ochrobactrum sp. Marseille-Q0166]|uniref:uroporphyrinogen-III synthase n=1 Tax=Ochrobactrum sp. Marseille-Q0166 TaxID=2761105 RepID=UPI00165542DC|nr:uroporphyrinogen-III synthase [Ochrobactrum sp. Marseille-Q0166]MBC8716475.1 uroporphyrinogen-III synthase [Ochrobactrum sp. Marseille-Q0166]